MRFLIVFFSSLALSPMALALDFQCKADPSHAFIKGEGYWLTLSWSEGARNGKSVNYQLLAENGFFTQTSFEISKFDFKEKASLTLGFDNSILSAKYDAQKDNYPGTLEDTENHRSMGVTCMKLKGF